MNAQLADLLELLELESLEVNLFRGESRDIGSPQVFGGQVLGQALTAASATVEGRIVAEFARGEATQETVGAAMMGSHGGTEKAA